MKPVIPNLLYRSGRPGYSGGANVPVGMGEVQSWIDAAQALGIASIICLLDDEHLCLYPDEDLLGIYRTAGFKVRHIPARDHSIPPLSGEQLGHVLQAYRELPKPVLIHCSAGLGRTGAAMGAHSGSRGMNDFYPGQRVLCIDGRFAPDIWEWTDRVPIEGEIYTVSGVVRCPHRLTGEYGGGLRLVEIDTEMPGADAAPRMNWDVSRFVPLDLAEIKSVSQKKKSVAKKKRTPRPRRKKVGPVLV